MPFRRRRFARSKARNTGFRRRRRFVRKPMTAGRVKRIIDAELKVVDHSIGPAFIPQTTGVVFHVSNIDQGDDNNARTGNWIKPASWMGTVTVNGNEAADPTLIPRFRVGCIVWKENQTLNPIVLGQFMQNTVDPHQQYNIENKGQFKILWSRTGVLSNQDTNPNYQKILRFYVKPSMKVLYDGDTLKNNQLFLFGFSDVDTALNPPQFTFSTRLRYTDS